MFLLRKKYRPRCSLVVALLCLGSLCALSQVLDIRGIVSDSATGERIPYANVAITGTNRGAAANASGFYLISNLSVGRFEVVASAVGYIHQAKTVDVEGTAPITLNFQLAPTSIQMEEITVRGEAKPTLLQMQPSVHLVDRTKLSKVPVAAQPDILRSIEILPGIVTTSDVNTQFFVRGGGSDQNLILLDGMRIYNPFHAFALFSTFDPEIVKTTEVYTGAFPAQYGGRLSSVINISTRDGNANRMTGEASMNFLSSKVLLEGPLSEDIQALASARKSMFSTTFKRFLNQTIPLSFYDGFLKLTRKEPGGTGKYSVQSFFSNDNLLPGNDTNPEYSWSSLAIGAEVQRLDMNRLFWSSNLSFGKFQQDRTLQPRSTADPLSNTVKELDLRADFTYYASSKDLYVFGYEFDFISTEFLGVSETNAPIQLNSSIPEFSAWLHYQTQWGWLKSNIGARVELGALARGAPEKSALQPRLNFSSDLSDFWRIKLAYGRFSQQLVTIANEDDIVPIVTPWISIPETQEPEWADHYVLGIEGPLLTELSASFETFYKYFGSIVAYNRDKIENAEPDYINSRGQAYGAQALMEYSSPLFDLYTAYTLSWVQIDRNGNEYPPRYDRRHTLNLLATARPFEAFDVSARWEFGSGLPFTQSAGFYNKLTFGRGYPNAYYFERGNPTAVYGPTNAARLPTYHRLDLNASYRVVLFSFFRTTVGVNLTNLYDRKNVFYFDRNTAQRFNMLRFFPSASITVAFLPAP